MSFQDIFKSSFYKNNGTVTFSLPDTLIAILLAFAIGMFIFFVYKKTYQGVMYNRQFGVSLIAMTLISTFILMAVTSNVVLSLGMVGALSIVRFRTAIKDPLDIVYLFWAVGAGIVLGASPTGGIGMYLLAVISCLVIGGILLLFVNIKGGAGEAYLLIVQCSGDAEKNVEAIVKEGAKKYGVKSKSVARSYTEITYDVRLNGNDTEFVNRVSGVENVEKAVLVSYNGDYMA